MYIRIRNNFGIKNVYINSYVGVTFLHIYYVKCKCYHSWVTVKKKQTIIDVEIDKRFDC